VFLWYLGFERMEVKKLIDFTTRQPKRKRTFFHKEKIIWFR
jgi:hypothetical protein